VLPTSDAPETAETRSDRAEDATLLPPDRRGRLVVLAILLVALVIRLAAVAWVHDGYAPLTDAKSFDTIASSIADGHGYGDSTIPGVVGPSAYRAPAWPAVLSVAYIVGGSHSWTLGLVEEAFIGTLLVGMVGVVAARVFGRRVALVAMALAAIHPTLVLYGTSLMLEPLLVTLELAAIAAALEHRRQPRGILWPVAAGVAIGLAVLTREIGFCLLPGVVLLVWVVRPRWSRSALQAPVAVLVAAAVVILPGTARNAVEFHRFVPVSSSSGIALAGTYNQSSYDSTDPVAPWIPALVDPGMMALVAAHPGADEAEVDALVRDEALRFAAHHPAYVAKAAVYNVLRLFDLDGGKQSRLTAQYIPYRLGLVRLSMYASWLLWALAVAALLVGAVRRRIRWELVLFPALFLANLALLSGNMRYRASIEPIAVVLAAALAVHLVGRARERQVTA
jgi:4-amino-4-deoxy-L-arabinose transferase-like glycosyltransferase